MTHIEQSHINLLINFVEATFVFDYRLNQFILYKHNIRKYLDKMIEINILSPPKLFNQRQACRTVMQMEWDRFLTNYSDATVYNNDFTCEKVLTLSKYLEYQFPFSNVDLSDQLKLSLAKYFA